MIISCVIAAFNEEKYISRCLNSLGHQELEHNDQLEIIVIDDGSSDDTREKVKNFKNEAKGIIWLLKYPENLKEIIWSAELALLRAYIWGLAHWDFKFKKVEYNDAWEKAESTR